MNVERAAEIIAAYGGDAARWPVDERAAALRVVGSDAALTRACHDSSAIDAELSAWSQRVGQAQLAPGAAAMAAARVLAVGPAARPARPVWRWAVGTGMAAAIAAGFMLTNPFANPLHGPAVHTKIAHSAASDAAAFAMVFTPTPDEDGSI